MYDFIINIKPCPVYEFVEHTFGKVDGFNIFNFFDFVLCLDNVK